MGRLPRIDMADGAEPRDGRSCPSKPNPQLMSTTVAPTSQGSPRTSDEATASRAHDAVVYPKLTCVENCQEAFNIAESRFPCTLAPWDGEPTLQHVYYPPPRADGQPNGNGVLEAYALLAPLIVGGPRVPSADMSEDATESGHTAVIARLKQLAQEQHKPARSRVA